MTNFYHMPLFCYFLNHHPVGTVRPRGASGAAPKPKGQADRQEIRRLAARELQGPGTSGTETSNGGVAHGPEFMNPLALPPRNGYKERNYRLFDPFICGWRLLDS